MTQKSPSLFDWKIAGPSIGDSLRKLLRLFITHAGKVLTHHYLLRDVWGPNAVEQTHYLRVHIAHLREKIEDNASMPELILTEPGIGYRFICLSPRSKC